MIDSTLKEGDLVFVTNTNFPVHNDYFFSTWEAARVERKTNKFFYVDHRWIKDKKIPIDSPRTGVITVIIPTQEQIDRWENVQRKKEVVSRLQKLDWFSLSLETLREIDSLTLG